MTTTINITQLPTDATPKSIRYAVLIIYYGILLAVAASFLDGLTGHESVTAMLISVVFSAAYLLIPVGIKAKRDNARYAYAVMEIVPIMLFLTGNVELTLFSLLSFYIQLPFVGYSIVLLFSKESNAWFKKAAVAAAA